jgi:ribosomal-protein-alanine N-acetyltransferase
MVEGFRFGPLVITPVLTYGDVGLRPLRVRDQFAWNSIRKESADWLRPWEATLPPEAQGAIPSTFTSMVMSLRREARAGRLLPWALTYQSQLVGQVTVGGIAYGSLRSASIGYWIGRKWAGRGITPIGVALAMDYCLDVLQLHRIEINIRPENIASTRVVEKLGMTFEGTRPAYLHIDGDWRDHLTYVQLAPVEPNTMRNRLGDTPKSTPRTSNST